MIDQVPDRPTLRPIVLGALYNLGGECSKQELAEEIAEAFQLSEKVRSETTAQGRNRLLNQIDWVTGKDLGIGSLGLVVDHGHRVSLTPLGERLIELFHEEEGWEIGRIETRIGQTKKKFPGIDRTP